MPKVGLALSGGGVKGLAHIGVIKVLEKNNIPINFIAGSSAGAVIGGIYASGTSIETLEKSILKMKKNDVLKFLLDFGKPGGGFIKAENIMKFVEEMLKERYIENFKIPFAAIATDLSNWEEKIFNRGDVLVAIRSSIAVPGIIKPLIFKKSILVDGGVINPLPIDIVKNMGSDIVIGVDVIGTPKKTTKINLKYVLTESVRLMEKQLSYLRIKNFENTIIIEPSIKNIGVFSTSLRNFKEAIRNGEKEAQKRLNEIKNLLEYY